MDCLRQNITPLRHAADDDDDVKSKCHGKKKPVSSECGDIATRFREVASNQILGVLDR